MPLPKVVIVGRPNVGKSSLFNWIAGRRIAIVEDVPGVTRDRVSTLVQLDSDAEPRFFEMIDTGGIGIIDREDLSEHVEKQIAIALEEADLILFVVDVRDGRMPLDEEVATKLRYLDKPVVLVVNKADVPALDERGHEFTRFGRGDPVYVSTRENRGKNELLELIGEKIPRWEDVPGNPVMKLAVVGRPNTGKSTFINQLAQSERMIVSEIAGTTRDSVDIRFELDGHPFLAIDTAGVRRQAKLRDSIDFFSLHRAQRSIRRADVVLLFFDPTQGITRLDKQLADYIAEQYKPCIFTVNKWDIIVNDMQTDLDAPDAARIVMKRFVTGIQYEFRTMAYMPIAFVTAKTGKNVKVLINTAQFLFKQANQRVGTGMLNRVLRQAVDAHAPMRQNRVPKIYFATQVGVAPTIVLFVNSPSLFDPTYRGYLLNAFRKHLPLADVPIKLYLRARKQEEGGLGAQVRDEADEGPTSEELWLQNQEVNEFLNDLNNE